VDYFLRILLFAAIVPFPNIFAINIFLQRFSPAFLVSRISIISRFPFSLFGLLWNFGTWILGFRVRLEALTVKPPPSRFP